MSGKQKGNKMAQAKTYIDKETKEEFEKLIKEYGFESTSTALRVYMKNCIRTNSLNLHLAGNEITNPRLIESIKQLERKEDD